MWAELKRVELGLFCLKTQQEVGQAQSEKEAFQRLKKKNGGNLRVELGVLVYFLQWSIFNCFAKI